VQLEVELQIYLLNSQTNAELPSALQSNSRGTSTALPTSMSSLFGLKLQPIADAAASAAVGRLVA
jgi:hypothetical protein